MNLSEKYFWKIEIEIPEPSLNYDDYSGLSSFERDITVTKECMSKENVHKSTGLKFTYEFNGSGFDYPSSILAAIKNPRMTGSRREGIPTPEEIDFDTKLENVLYNQFTIDDKLFDEIMNSIHYLNKEIRNHTSNSKYNGYTITSQ